MNTPRDRFNARIILTEAGRCPAGRARRFTPRRGIAMMLVMGMLAAVTVLTAAAITSQQGAPDAGMNAVAEVQARWSAESAANLAVAVLETNFDFSGSNASMMVDEAIAQGLADVKLTTVDGRAPTAQDTELMLTASSTVNGVTREVQKRISLTPAVALEDAVDPQLSEFGIVGMEEFDLDNSINVSKWTLSPAAASVKPVSVGVFGTDSSKVSHGSSPALSRVAFFTGANADTGLASKAKSSVFATGGRKLPYVVPTVPSLTPTVFSSLSPASTCDINLNSTKDNITLSTGGRYESLLVQNGAIVHINSSKGTYYSFEDIQIANTGVLMIEGPVLINVRDDFRVLNHGAVVLGDSTAAAAIFTKGDVQISDSGIGVPVAVARDSNRKVGSLTSYTNPSRIRLYAQPSCIHWPLAPAFSIDSNSLVIACIHAPSAAVYFDHKATLIGRVTGWNVRFRQSASLVYDPALDKNTGYTNPKSVLYASDGSALAPLSTTLSSFNTDNGTAALKDAVKSVGSSLAIGGQPIQEDELGTPAVLSGSVALTPRTTRSVCVRPVERDNDRNNDHVADAQGAGK